MGCKAGQYCDDSGCPTHGETNTPRYSSRRSSEPRVCHAGQYCEDPECPSHGKGSGGSCFAAGTAIASPSGSRAIESLKVGDWVTSWNERCQQPTIRRVTKVICTPRSRTWILNLSNGTVLRATKKHRLLSSIGWVTVDKAPVGTQLSHVSQGQLRPVAVIAKHQFERVEPTFNLHTEGEHTYVACGIVVHNFSVAPVVRCLLHRLVLDRLRLMAPPIGLNAWHRGTT